MIVKSEVATKIKQSKLITQPVDHIVIDNFLPEKVASTLSEEFSDYESDNWHIYSNAIEEKRTCNIWNMFKKETYNYFRVVFSATVNQAMSEKFKIEIEPDFGLHGGGQHIHSKMGNLNPHLDYSIHPKIGLERRLNAIYYLTGEYEEEDGGHFGLWENNSPNEPGKLLKEYAPIFNRLVLFNTSQNSWHGLSRVYKPKANRLRKSLASYYISNPREDSLTNTRALFAPRAEQLGDNSVLEQINRRASEEDHEKAYIVKK